MGPYTIRTTVEQEVSLHSFMARHKISTASKAYIKAVEMEGESMMKKKVKMQSFKVKVDDSSTLTVSAERVVIGNKGDARFTVNGEIG